MTELTPNFGRACSHTEPAIAIVARSDPNEQEHTILYGDSRKD